MSAQLISNVIPQQNQPVWLDKFVTVYSQLSVDNLSLLDDLYHDNVSFVDPMHSLEGFEALKSYFDNLYSNLASCNFTIVQVIHEGNQASVYWKMSYCHPYLRKGKEVEVSGTSHIQGDDDKVRYHRDFVDLGAMLYEHIPFVGALIGFIKRRASNND